MIGCGCVQPSFFAVFAQNVIYFADPPIHVVMIPSLPPDWSPTTWVSLIGRTMQPVVLPVTSTPRGLKRPPCRAEPMVAGKLGVYRAAGSAAALSVWPDGPMFLWDSLRTPAASSTPHAPALRPTRPTFRRFSKILSAGGGLLANARAPVQRKQSCSVFEENPGKGSFVAAAFSSSFGSAVCPS